MQPREFDPTPCSMEELKTQPKELVNKLRLALLVNGVDVGGRIGGFLSCTHTADDVAQTAAAFRECDPHAAAGRRTGVGRLAAARVMAAAG